MPPPKAALPGSYDFANAAYFAGISAVGYSLTDIEVLNQNKESSYFIAQLRQQIYERITAALPINIANFAAALMIGETSALNRNLLKNMRIAGISHILAVSGLHLSLITMLVFFLSRLILNLIPAIALKYDIKPFAAFIALLASIFYLLISGMKIAAIRAFIMTLILIISINIKRPIKPIR